MDSRDESRTSTRPRYKKKCFFFSFAIFGLAPMDSPLGIARFDERCGVSVDSEEINRA